MDVAAQVALLTNGSARSIRLVDHFTSSLPPPPPLLELCIPFTIAGCTIETRVDSIENVIEEATATRRAACARAASARLDGSAATMVTEDISDTVEAAGEDELLLRLQQANVAYTIGGKVWDASLLASSWLAENAHRLPPPASDGARPRVLELGAGIGVMGLACAFFHPHLQMTISDYDPAVIACIEQNVVRNLRADGRDTATLPDAANVDFRDFTPEAVAAAEEGIAVPVTSPLRKYANANLLHAFDCIIASDVVYDAYHGQLLPHVCRALLKRDDSTRAPDAWQPCALLVLPDSRPKLREFVASVPAAGLACTIERLMPPRRLRQRLESAHEGWGEGWATFSLHALEHRTAVARSHGTA